MNRLSPINQPPLFCLRPRCQRGWIGALVFSIYIPVALADRAETPVPVIQIPESLSAAADVSSGPMLPITNPAAVVAEFSTAYTAAQEPRLLLVVNRRLLPSRGEMLSVTESRTSIQTKGDPVAIASPSVQIGSDNQVGNAAQAVSGAGGERLETASRSERVHFDRPLGVGEISEAEARSIEESFLARFLEARAKLVDQRVADISRQSPTPVSEQFLTATPGTPESDEVARLKASADVIIEVLVRNDEIVIPQPSGMDQIRRRVALTATAIRLSDGILVAQIDSDTLFGFNQRQGERQVRRFSQVTSSEVIEQTALALMQRLRF